MDTSAARRAPTGDEGAIFLEYGLVAALVAIVVAVAVGPFGAAVNALLALAVGLF